MPDTVRITLLFVLSGLIIAWGWKEWRDQPPQDRLDDDLMP